MSTIQTWNGSAFVYPDANNATKLGGVVPGSYAAASHVHVRASITDFAHKSTHATGGTDVLLPSDIGALALTGGALTGKLTIAAGLANGIWFPDGATSDTAGIYLLTKTGEDIEMTIKVGNDANDTVNFVVTSQDGVLVNGSKVWNAGNLNPGNYSLTTHNHTYDVNNAWLREFNDDANVKIFGNTRQMAFRADGTTEYATGVGAYPFVWMYGGDAAANRAMYLTSAGDLWTNANGLLSTALTGKVPKVSTARPGVTKLYRQDNDSDYSVQTTWDGTYWQLKGYSVDTYHGECMVGNADKVDGVHASSFVRTDAAGVWTMASNSNASAFSSAIQIRELNMAGAGVDAWATAPRLAFHWSGRVASQIAIQSTGRISIINNPGTAYEAFQASQVYGAVYNDYAECRQSFKEIERGRIAMEGYKGYIYECDKRMAKGAMATSDTYGFNIAEQDIPGELSIPIAVAGRVLVFTDKPRDKFNIGDAVCSGYNGTVSKMRWWERILFPDRIVGIVSEIPDYETWGTDNVEVKGRIWIRV